MMARGCPFAEIFQIKAVHARGTPATYFQLTFHQENTYMYMYHTFKIVQTSNIS